MLYLTTLIVSMIITIALMPFARKAAIILHAMDEPNARKIHGCIIPKCGGMAMALGVMIPLLLWAPNTQFSKALLIGSSILVFFGVVDDIRDLKFMAKFTSQISAALIAVIVGGIKISSLGSLLPGNIVLPEWIAIPLTLVAIVGVTNATNLADGLDGLAGGISLLIFICIGYFGYIKGDFTVVIFSVAIGGAILGFLRFNSHPATLFMGDAGSQVLGYMAIVLSLRLSQTSDGLTAVLPLFFIGLPIVDTLTVMTKRLAQGKPPFIADKKHFHHQLISMGLYHSEAVLSVYLIQALYIILAITLQNTNDWILLIVYLAFSIAIVLIFNIIEIKHFKVNRQKILNPVKARLRHIKEKGLIIRYSFKIVRIGVPSLFILSCVIAKPQSMSYFIFSSLFVVLIFFTWLFNNSMVEQITKLGLYVITPFLIYAGDRGVSEYMGHQFVIIYNILFVALFVFLLITIKFTRRKGRFKSTTLDFLVVFLILLIGILPNTVINNYKLGLISGKILIMFFGYEILLGEMQQRSNKMAMVSLMLLVLVGLKGLISIGYFP